MLPRQCFAFGKTRKIIENVYIIRILCKSIGTWTQIKKRVDVKYSRIIADAWFRFIAEYVWDCFCGNQLSRKQFCATRVRREAVIHSKYFLLMYPVWWFSIVYGNLWVMVLEFAFWTISRANLLVRRHSFYLAKFPGLLRLFWKKVLTSTIVCTFQRLQINVSLVTRRKVALIDFIDVA